MLFVVNYFSQVFKSRFNPLAKFVIGDRLKYDLLPQLDLTTDAIFDAAQEKKFSLRYCDLLKIKLKLKELEQTKFSVTLSIFNSKNLDQLLAKVLTFHACINSKTCKRANFA